ncbi:MAG: DNA polymerase III subunit delta [Burkholderiales bacterium]|jgi:DNA polymerase-3 subunit delta|nr:DNA polymerase III subunit delta [Burkholderiales bacterium]
MQIRFDDLEKHLTKLLSPLYVVHGDEALFVQEAGDAIRHAAREAGCIEREVFVVESGFKWDSLLAAHSNLGLFGERRLLDLRIPSGKPGTEGAKVLERYAQTLDAQQVTLITLPRADKTMQATGWFKALEAVGTVVPVQPLEREALPRWIGERLRRQGQQATDEMLAYLADHCEGNLLAARQEIEKLELLFPAGALTMEMVETAIADVARYDVFALSEAWLAGDAARVVRLLQALRDEGEAVTLPVWQFSEDVHALCAVRALTMQGMAAAQAVRQARVWGRRQAAMEKAARRVPNAALPGFLRTLAKLDAQAKGLTLSGPPVDVWQNLATTALAFCGVQEFAAGKRAI